MKRVSYAVEGWSDERVAELLIREVGFEPWQRFVARGKSKLDPKLRGYNASAKRQPWLVLRDLDTDAPCAGQLVGDLIGEPAPGMALRVPVRAVEAWLMADRQAVARHFGIALTKLPTDPDRIEDPKGKLVDLCRRSRRATVRAAMVPAPRSGRKAGPEYEASLREFTIDAWRLHAAMEVSSSLRRTVGRLRLMVESGAWS